MESAGGGSAIPSGTRSGRRSDDRDPEVEERLRNLYLTMEEAEIAEMSDDEDEDVVNWRWHSLVRSFRRCLSMHPWF